MILTDWLPERRVRRIHLRAPDETLSRRGGILLEDALRTASVPGGNSGRLLIIRHLDAIRIDTRYGPTSLSLAIEQRLQQIVAEQTLYAGTPGAAAAPVVYFHDQLDAVLSLAVRLARGPEPLEWFWPLAVPGWHAGMSYPEALRHLLDTALCTPAGITAGVIILRELLAISSLELLLEALVPQDGLFLLQAFGLKQADMPADPHGVQEQPAFLNLLPMSPAWKPVLRRWVEAWGISDPRSIFLAAVALAAENPNRLAAPGKLMADAIRLVSALILVSDFSYQQPPGANTALRLSDPVPAPFADPLAAPVVRTMDESQVSNRLFIDGQPTVLAGLFFLLPLLSHLGMPEFLDAQPELWNCELPRRILIRICERSAVPPDDPVMAALKLVANSLINPFEPVSFVVPPFWQARVCHPPSLSRPWQVRRQAGSPGVRLLLDNSGELVLAAWRLRVPFLLRQLIGTAVGVKGIQSNLAGAGVLYSREPLPARDGLYLLIDSWVTALRRCLRLDSGLALGELLHQPGRLSITATSLDITLSLRNVDLRIRKAGLDIDAGWLPWFGKIVKFHYE